MTSLQPFVTAASAGFEQQQGACGGARRPAARVPLRGRNRTLATRARARSRRRAAPATLWHPILGMLRMKRRRRRARAPALMLPSLIESPSGGTSTRVENAAAQGAAPPAPPRRRARARVASMGSSLFVKQGRAGSGAWEYTLQGSVDGSVQLDAQTLVCFI